MAERQRAQGITLALLQYMQDNPNRVVVIQDLIDALENYSDTQLIKGMWHIIKSDMLPGLEKVAQGVWRYIPGEFNGRPSVTFEVLKETEDSYVLMDSQGDVYKAVMLG